MAKLLYQGNDLMAVSSEAKGIAYDNSTSGISATSVQDAIDEVNTDKASYSALESSINSLNSNLTNGSLVAKYSDTFKIQSINSTWKNKPGLYYYEGADTSTCDLPYPHCFVLHFDSPNSDRGVAVCLRWANLGSYSTSTTIWTNGKQDGWIGWRAIN